MAQGKTSRRAMLGGIAALSAAAAVAAPTIATPAAVAASPALTDFDIALARYNALARADDIDSAQGDLRVAYSLYDARTKEWFERYGTCSKAPEDVQSAWAACNRDMSEAEARHQERFTDPRWAAAETLLAIPAPSVGAVAEKLRVAKIEDYEAPQILAFVEADLRRLAA